MNEEPQATSSSDDPLSDLYRKYCPSMVRVDLKTADGDFASAAAFHIGDGWLVTARHVIDGGELAGLTAHKYAQVSKLRQVIYPKEEREDVALLETDFSLKHYMTRTHIHGLADSWKADHIPIGGHLDDWIGDELVMTRVTADGIPACTSVGRGAARCRRGRSERCARQARRSEFPLLRHLATSKGRLQWRSGDQRAWISPRCDERSFGSGC